MPVYGDGVYGGIDVTEESSEATGTLNLTADYLTTLGVTTDYVTTLNITTQYVTSLSLEVEP